MAAPTAKQSRATWSARWVPSSPLFLFYKKQERSRTILSKCEKGEETVPAPPVVPTSRSRRLPFHASAYPSPVLFISLIELVSNTTTPDNLLSL